MLVFAAVGSIAPTLDSSASLPTTTSNQESPPRAAEVNPKPCDRIDLAEHLIGHHPYYEICPIDDVDRDGVTDLLVSSPMADDAHDKPTQVVVISGSEGKRIRTHPAPVKESSFGEALAALGDLNHDGVSEYAIGDPGFRTVREVDVELVEGSVSIHSGVDGSLLSSAKGTRKGDRFGTAIAGLGDVDRDGTADYAVSSPARFMDGSGRRTGGLIEIYSGKTRSVLSTIVVDPRYENGGYCMRSVGDVDRDGASDLVLATREKWQKGHRPHLQVCSGVTGKPLWTWTRDVEVDIALTGGRDLNSDGVPDVVVGVPTIEKARVVILSGKDGSEIREIVSSPSDAGCLISDYASSIALLDDVDADGVAEIAIASPNWEPWIGGEPVRDIDVGAVWIHSGRSGQLLDRVVGTSDGDGLGLRVCEFGAHASCSRIAVSTYESVLILQLARQSK